MSKKFKDDGRQSGRDIAVEEFHTLIDNMVKALDNARISILKDSEEQGKEPFNDPQYLANEISKWIDENDYKDAMILQYLVILKMLKGMIIDYEDILCGVWRGKHSQDEAGLNLFEQWILDHVRTYYSPQVFELFLEEGSPIRFINVMSNEADDDMIIN